MLRSPNYTEECLQVIETLPDDATSDDAREALLAAWERKYPTQPPPVFPDVTGGRAESDEEWYTELCRANDRYDALLNLHAQKKQHTAWRRHEYLAEGMILFHHRSAQ